MNLVRRARNMETDHEHRKHVQSEGARSRLLDMTDAARSRHVYVWAVCASVSIVTSKYLLVDLNFHFPLHLHIWQLMGVIAFTSCNLLRHPLSPNERLFRLTGPQWIFLVLLAVSIATSLIFSIEALLHYPNVTTIAMLSTIPYIPESLMTLFNTQPGRSSASVLRIGVLLASCVLILFGEYRLWVKGLLTALPAAIFIGVSRILYTGGARYFPEVVAEQRRIDIVSCGAGILIGAVWIGIFGVEDPWRVKDSLRFSFVPLILVNILVTTTAIVLGRSTLFPPYATDYRIAVRSQKESGILDVIAIIIITGITGLVSTLTLRRAYIGYGQIIAFCIAIICIGGSSVSDLLQLGRIQADKGYSLVSPPAELEMFDGASTAASEDAEWWLDETNSVAIDKDQNKKAISPLYVAIAVGAIWIIFLLLNFSEIILSSPSKVVPILDQGYTPSVNQEIVVSMYKEPVEHVTSMLSKVKDMAGISDARVHIYTKDPKADVETLKKQTGAHNVTLLPNIGREGETYLYHIIDNWDNLAKQTFFLQADVHNPREFYPRIHDYFDSERTGMLSLGWSGIVCNCQECGDVYDMRDPLGLFPQLHQRITNSTTCETVLLSYKGQFVASAKRIRGIDKAIYKYLRDAFVDEKSWAHSEPYLLGRPDSMNAPQFGYQMERMWNLLFQCSDMDIAFKCPSLVSGSRFGGRKDDCQCYDPVS
ncbi:hypothetical protein B0J11DRAFT_12740 [Dendryphion nanum]|uniref:Uncharacterized protein n=1 Tax=Dendryphion nanum TaxID=256645 RepID=A0A9P9EF43_9PLEO|nr:hypothetical protein B0J11DRAFT_12740 [Dendryphion nanum]